MATKTQAPKTVVKLRKIEKGSKSEVGAEPKMFNMPKEVSEWIEQANSRMMHMQTKISRLEADNKALRAANKVMEQRVMGMSVE